MVGDRIGLEAAFSCVSLADRRQDYLAFLEEHDFRSPLLRWYVDYACRDDFGCRAADVSAWAGLHYFASRGGDESALVTWPEGNGWLAARLRERLAPRIRTATLVFRVGADGTLDAYAADEDRSVRIRAGSCPISVKTVATVSTRTVGPQTKVQGPISGGQATSANIARSIRRR